MPNYSVNSSFQNRRHRVMVYLVRGDLKKALARLRGGARSKTHHFSTFRSGFLVGVAIPALASGIYNSTVSPTVKAIGC